MTKRKAKTADIQKSREELRAEDLEKTGRCAYASIVEMVQALDEPYCAENTDGELIRETLGLEDGDAIDDEQRDEALEELNEQDPEDRKEDAQTRISEDPLCIEVRSGWVTPGDDMTAEEFSILLTTGGPAVRIRGELDEHSEPRRAWLEVQDWGTPWTHYFGASQETLLTYCRQFSFYTG